MLAPETNIKFKMSVAHIHVYCVTTTSSLSSFRTLYSGLIVHQILKQDLEHNNKSEQMIYTETYEFTMFVCTKLSLVMNYSNNKSLHTFNCINRCYYCYRQIKFTTTVWLPYTLWCIIAIAISILPQEMYQLCASRVIIPLYSHRKPYPLWEFVETGKNALPRSK